MKNKKTKQEMAEELQLKSARLNLRRAEQELRAMKRQNNDESRKKFWGGVKKIGKSMRKGKDPTFTMKLSHPSTDKYTQNMFR